MNVVKWPMKQISLRRNFKISKTAVDNRSSEKGWVKREKSCYKSVGASRDTVLLGTESCVTQSQSKQPLQVHWTQKRPFNTVESWALINEYIWSGKKCTCLSKAWKKSPRLPFWSCSKVIVLQKNLYHCMHYAAQGSLYSYISTIKMHLLNLALSANRTLIVIGQVEYIWLWWRT